MCYEKRQVGFANTTKINKTYLRIMTVKMNIGSNNSYCTKPERVNNQKPTFVLGACTKVKEWVNRTA